MISDIVLIYGLTLACFSCLYRVCAWFVSDRENHVRRTAQELQFRKVSTNCAYFAILILLCWLVWLR